MLLVSREGTREGRVVLVVLIKFIVRVRHALIHKGMTLVYMYTHTHARYIAGLRDFASGSVT